MRFVGQDAEPYLDPAAAQRDWPSRASALNEQSRVVEVLEREYGSVGRLAAGAAGTVVLCFAVTVAGLAAGILVSGELTAGDVVLLVVGGIALTAGLAIPGWWLGRSAVRSGRSVVAALVRWHRLPETVAPDGSFVPPEQRRSADAISAADRRRVATRDAVLARTYVFQGPLFVRIAVSGLLLVAVLMAWGMAISGFVVGEEAFDYASATTVGGVAAVLTASLVYVWGGAYRVNAAHAGRDPLMRRFRRGRP